MGLPGALLAIVLPTLAGMAIVRGLLPRAVPVGSVALVAGGGFVIGAVLTGAGMMFTASLAPNVSLALVAALLAILAAASVALFRRTPPAAPCAPEPIPPAGRWLLGLVVAVAAANLWMMFGEVLQRPLLGWDAWKVWAVKPQIWRELSPAVDFVSPSAWLASDDPLVHTISGYAYPELIGRYQLWIAQWSGGWAGGLVFLPWPLLWLALNLAFLGLCRLLAVGWTAALVATALLAMAPFPAVHGALPGYMDLWIAVQAMLAVGLLAAWLVDRRPAALLLAAVLLLALVGTKHEGLLWAIIIGVAAALAGRPARQVGSALLVGLAVLAVWALGGGLGWEVSGQEIALRPDRIALPYIGSAELRFENRLGAFATALFVLPNWHVLAGLFVVLAVVVLPGRDWHPHRLLAGLFLLFGLSFLFVLFNFTPAGYWAEDLTASNRLTMHLVPAGWLLLVLSYARLEEARAGTPELS